MNRSIRSMVGAAVVLLFGFASSVLAQEPGQARPPMRAVPQSDQVRPPAPVPELPVAVQSALPSAPGTLFIPKSSVAQTPAPGEKLTAHTNVQIYIPSGFNPEELPPYGGYAYETPASIGCHYGLVTVAAGIAPNCNPNSTTVNPTGGGGTIAIVDAYDDPEAPADLAWFSLQFGIPLTLSQFQVVWANTNTSSCNIYGVPIDYSGGWEVEESLDIEWSHAMAPKAKIYLVEACSNYDSDLAQAVLVANNLVQCGSTEINPSTLALGTCPSVTGAGMVSMSFGQGEFPGETSYDSYFNAANVQYFSSSGDSPGVSWPCVSVNVICAGGTTNRRNNFNGNFEQETAWVFGGGGISFYEPIPCYQAGGTCDGIVDAAVGHCTAVAITRCVPDVSFDADPYTGVWVYDTFPVDGLFYYSWYIVGGTSVSSPSLAGIFNAAQFGGNAGGTATGVPGSSNAELAYIYFYRTNAADYTLILSGFCGFYMGTSPPTSGWSLCNGIGVDNGYLGK